MTRRLVLVIALGLGLVTTPAVAGDPAPAAAVDAPTVDHLLNGLNETLNFETRSANSR